MRLSRIISLLSTLSEIALIAGLVSVALFALTVLVVSRARWKKGQVRKITKSESMTRPAQALWPEVPSRQQKDFTETQGMPDPVGSYPDEDEAELTPITGTHAQRIAAPAQSRRNGRNANLIAR